MGRARSFPGHIPDLRRTCRALHRAYTGEYLTCPLPEHVRFKMTTRKALFVLVGLLCSTATAQQQVSTRAVYINRNFRLGVSASHNGGPTERNVFGGYGGIRIGAASLMGEVDFIFDNSSSGETDQLAAFGSIDYLLSPAVSLYSFCVVPTVLAVSGR